MIWIAKRKKIFEREIKEELEVTPKSSSNIKMIRAKNTLQASHGKDANKIVGLAKQEKNIGETLNFLIDLATLWKKNQRLRSQKRHEAIRKEF